MGVLETRGVGRVERLGKGGSREMSKRTYLDSWREKHQCVDRDEGPRAAPRTAGGTVCRRGRA